MNEFTLNQDLILLIFSIWVVLILIIWSRIVITAEDKKRNERLLNKNSERIKKYSSLSKLDRSNIRKTDSPSNSKISPKPKISYPSDWEIIREAENEKPINLSIK